MEHKKTGPIRGLLIRRLVLAVMLTLAAFLAWERYRPAQEMTTVPTPTAQAVPSSGDERSAREAAYAKDLEALRALAASEDDVISRQAAAHLEQIVSEHQTELGIEETLQQAGYQPCLALMHNGALTVMLAQEQLTDAASAAVLALCAAHTELPVENIRIMAYTP